jgi:hypothetical protein
MHRRVLQNAAIFLTSTLIALGGIEIGLRIWGPDVVRMGSAFTFHRFDPVLGWDNLAGAEGRFTRLEFSYPVRINADGLYDADVREKKQGEFRVAVLGDSFTWGLGVPYGERFTEIVEARHPRINVLNFGVTAFSPVQHLLQVDRALAHKADYVVMALCLANDLYENVTYNVYSHPKPYVKLADNSDGFEVRGYPLPARVETGSYIFGWTSRFRLVSLVNMYIDQRRHAAPGEADDLTDIDAPVLYVPADRISDPTQRQHVADTYKLNELIIAAMKRKIEAALGPDRYAVMLVPMRWDFPGNPPRPDAVHDTVAKGVLASLSRLGIPTIDGRAVLTPDDFWARDIHWRPSGHKKIGVQLGDFLGKLID